MDLRTRAGRLLVLRLPGPQEREVNLLAARVFALTGESSALALPPWVPIAVLGEGDPGGTRTELAALWKGVEGGFEAGGLALSRGILELRLGGPFGALRRAASRLLRASPEAPPEVAADGTGAIFLGFHPGAEEGTLLAAIGPPPPFRFRAAALALVEVEAGRDSGLVWREESRGWRPRTAGGAAGSPLSG